MADRPLPNRLHPGSESGNPLQGLGTDVTARPCHRRILFFVPDAGARRQARRTSALPSIACCARSTPSPRAQPTISVPVAA